MRGASSMMPHIFLLGVTCTFSMERLFSIQRSIQLSPMPGISYTPVSYTISGKKDAATPLFDWGKYVERQGRWMLVFTVQVHHSFVDGIPIGKLADSIQKRLDAF